MNKLIVGDCLEIMAGFPDGFFDLVLTDPPWNVSSEGIIHRSMNPIKYRAKTDIVHDFGPWDKFESEEVYLAFTEAWIREAARVLKEHGHLVTFFDLNRVTPLIAFAENSGLKMRQHLFWERTNPVPRARKVDFMIALYHASWFTKGSKSGATFNYFLGQQRNVVQAAIPRRPRLHPTQKPLEPLRVWIRYLTNPGDLVLDPFAGSGSTGIACILEGRNYILIEKDEEFARRAAKWLRETSLQLQLF